MRRHTVNFLRLWTSILLLVVLTGGIGILWIVLSSEGIPSRCLWLAVAIFAWLTEIPKPCRHGGLFVRQISCLWSWKQQQNSILCVYLHTGVVFWYAKSLGSVSMATNPSSAAARKKQLALYAHFAPGLIVCDGHIWMLSWDWIDLAEIKADRTAFSRCDKHVDKVRGGNDMQKHC